MTRLDTLYDIVKRAATRVGSLQMLADASGLTLSALLRGAKNRHHSADTCLAIAEAGGEDPSVVLRAAGKGETADRIERLYGPPREPLSNPERAFLDLEPEIQRQLLRLVTALQRGAT